MLIGLLLTLQIIVSVTMVGVVLLQRSEGGGFVGGGSSAGISAPGGGKCKSFDVPCSMNKRPVMMRSTLSTRGVHVGIKPFMRLPFRSEAPVYRDSAVRGASNELASQGKVIYVCTVSVRIAACPEAKTLPSIPATKRR